MNIGFFGTADPKGCKRCLEQDDEVVEMEPTSEWSPKLAAYVDAWKCPECGRTLAREEAGDVGLTSPSGERF